MKEQNEVTFSTTPSQQRESQSRATRRVAIGAKYGHHAELLVEFEYKNLGYMNNLKYMHLVIETSVQVREINI